MEQCLDLTIPSCLTQCSSMPCAFWIAKIYSALTASGTVLSVLHVLLYLFLPKKNPFRDLCRLLSPLLAICPGSHPWHSAYPFCLGHFIHAICGSYTGDSWISISSSDFCSELQICVFSFYCASSPQCSIVTSNSAFPHLRLLQPPSKCMPPSAFPILVNISPSI